MVGRKRLQNAIDHYRERAGDDIDFTIHWKPFRYVMLYANRYPGMPHCWSDGVKPKLCLICRLNPDLPQDDPGIISGC